MDFHFAGFAVGDFMGKKEKPKETLLSVMAVYKEDSGVCRQLKEASPISVIYP